MKINLRAYLVIFFLILIAYACKKDEVKIIKEKVTGHVQKGPFIKGTSISIFGLDQFLQQTDNIFSSGIIDNSGAFEINNISLISGFAEFTASGLYYNEITGELTIDPLTLSALSDISNISAVNVNALTHLENLRIRSLLRQNEIFPEAKKKAQSEIFAVFGFIQNDIEDSENLDMLSDSNGNAILLAISVILQGNRSVSDLAGLLAYMANDLSDDGVLNSDSLIVELRKTTKDLNLAEIRSNLENRYTESGINSAIPGFEKYVNDFLAYTGRKPIISNLRAFNLKATKADLTAEVTSNCLSGAVTFEYGTTMSYGSSVVVYPTTQEGTDLMSVNTLLTGLSENTTYHFRIKATNSGWTTYSSDGIFSTLETVTDIDGNKYGIVKIGTQTWMAENLKTTRFNNGEEIPLCMNQSTLMGFGNSFYCWYDYKISNKLDYGALYSFFAIDDEGPSVCPIGWHVPTATDWQILIDYIGGPNEGGRLKEVGLLHWKPTNIGAGNETNFSALPGGAATSEFGSMGNRGYWWSSSQAYMYDNPWKPTFFCYRIGLERWTGKVWGGYYVPLSGASVRCLKD